MKKLIILAFVLFPALPGSGEYTRSVFAGEVVENRAGLTVSVNRSALSRRIENFAVRHGADPKRAVEYAEFLATRQHPRVLAAIAAKESRFNVRAVGKVGEIGAFQQRPELHGHPGRSFESQAAAAERHLVRLVKNKDGKLHHAVRSYNGSGPAADRYAAHVMAMARSI